MKKKILVLASGGLDSTYLINENLKKDNYVKAIYVNIENNGTKTESEIKALSLQRDYFNETFNKKNQLYTFCEDVFKVEINQVCSDLMLKQMPLWVMAILYNCADIDEVQVGYVMNDDAISYLNDFVDFYNSFQPLFPNKLPELTFPLSKTKKQEMFSELPQALKETIVFCEAPYFNEKENKYVPCDSRSSCGSCRRYRHENLFDEIIDLNHKIYIKEISSKSDASKQLKFDFPEEIPSQLEPAVKDLNDITHYENEN